MRRCQMGVDRWPILADGRTRLLFYVHQPYANAKKKKGPFSHRIISYPNGSRLLATASGLQLSSAIAQPPCPLVFHICLLLHT